MSSWSAIHRFKPLALTVALVLLAARLVWLYIVPAWQTIITDFPNYYVSAWAVRHGDPLGELYSPLWFDAEKRRSGIERPAALFNYFPPIDALIMWPVANLRPIAAKRVWTIVNVIALIGVIHLTGKSAGLRWPAAAVVALLAGDGLGNNFTYGQFYIVLTLLMLAAAVFAKRSPPMAGVAAAAGAVTKLFPAVLLVYFAIRREYRALIWSIAAMIVMSLIGLLAVGWTPHHIYATEVLARSLRGEIQDPYNVHWNTLQALVRRALVRDELLNPQPVFDAPWLFFFVRPLISVFVVAATLYVIYQSRRRQVLLAFGALIAMVSLITPSQASYHQFLFYPGIAGLVAIEESWLRKVIPAVLFGLICWNIMGATAAYDRGAAMILAFPRVWLVIVLWMMFLVALDAPLPKPSMPVAAAAVTVIALAAGMAVLENRRWIADVSDGATLVPLASSSELQLQPRFVGGRLVTAFLGPDGVENALPQNENSSSTSPDGQWTAFSTNARGNWDIAIRSNRNGGIRYLTSSSANDLTPSFAPDGRSVYFASDRHRGYRFTTIYQVSVDAR